MPKLPMIQAEEPLPRRSPYNGPDPDAASAPMRALTGAAQIGHTGQQVYAQGQELLDKQREAEDTVEAMQLRTRFGQELAALDGKLRMAKDFDLGTHAETLTKEGNTLLEKVAGEAKRPEVANLLRQHGAQALGTRAIAHSRRAHHLLVTVVDGDVATALKRVKNEFNNGGLKRLLRPNRTLHEYVAPGLRRRRKSAAARARTRRAAVKSARYDRDRGEV